VTFARKATKRTRNTTIGYWDWRFPMISLTLVLGIALVISIGVIALVVAAAVWRDSRRSETGDGSSGWIAAMSGDGSDCGASDGGGCDGGGGGSGD
jgi:hypothetical protein